MSEIRPDQPVSSGSQDKPEVVNIMWKPASDTSMRARIVPMIADALTRIPPLGMDITAWDMVTIAMPNAIMVGVALAVRGYALTGQGKEIMQFRAFSSWRPDQTEVDQVVSATVEALRIARAKQVNGQ